VNPKRCVGKLFANSALADSCNTPVGQTGYGSLSRACPLPVPSPSPCMITGDGTGTACPLPVPSLSQACPPRTSPPCTSPSDTVPWTAPGLRLTAQGRPVPKTIPSLPGACLKSVLRDGPRGLPWPAHRGRGWSPETVPGTSQPTIDMPSLAAPRTVHGLSAGTVPGTGRPYDSPWTIHCTGWGRSWGVPGKGRS
jgi:hypothetical protein